MNRRDTVLALLALGVAAPPLISPAQAPARVQRIGFVQPLPVSLDKLPFEAFKQGLREFGYVEGKNIVIEFRSAEGNHGRLPDLVAELVASRIDVLVAATGRTAQEAKRVTSSVPIVMANSADAVPQRIIESLARPGGNVTGLTSLSSELAPKRLELLKDLLPRLKKVAVLWCPWSEINRIEIGNVQAAAKMLRLEVQLVDYDRTPTPSRDPMESLKRDHPDALFLLDCTILPFQTILDFSLQHRLPVMSPYLPITRLGGLVSYGPDPSALARRAAGFVDKLLKGARPADLPVEQPTTFELAVNMKTAKTLGITIPRSVLIRADEVIR